MGIETIGISSVRFSNNDDAFYVDMLGVFVTFIAIRDSRSC